MGLELLETGIKLACKDPLLPKDEWLLWIEFLKLLKLLEGLLYCCDPLWTFIGGWMNWLEFWDKWPELLIEFEWLEWKD